MPGNESVEMIDLNQSPYRAYVLLLEKLRDADESSFERVKYRANKTEKGTFDANWQERERVVNLLHFSAKPSDLMLCRRLLDEEILSREEDSFQGAGDTLMMLSYWVSLFSDDFEADTLRFWRAKHANFDTYAGGYDREFIFSLLSADDVFALMKKHTPERQHQERDAMEPFEDVEEMTLWRESLNRRFPQSFETFTDSMFESWAETFGDRTNQIQFGLQRAKSHQDRARVFERANDHRQALAEWEKAASETTSAADKISLLTKALHAAAECRCDALDVARQIDELATNVDGWNTNRLGFMATGACYRAAALSNEERGEELWKLASSWQAYEHLSVAFLEHALIGAKKWGSANDAIQIERTIEEKKASWASRDD